MLRNDMNQFSRFTLEAILTRGSMDPLSPHMLLTVNKCDNDARRNSPQQAHFFDTGLTTEVHLKKKNEVGLINMFVFLLSLFSKNLNGTRALRYETKVVVFARFNFKVTSDHRYQQYILTLRGNFLILYLYPQERLA